MKRGIAQRIAALGIALLTVCGCGRDAQEISRYTFNAHLEQPGSNAKLRLSGDSRRAENTLVWEYNDEISIGSDKTLSLRGSGNDDTASKGWLYYAGGSDFSETHNGVFQAQLPEGSSYFVGLHPYSHLNEIVGQAAGNSNFTTVRLNLPATQGYRCDTTFDKQVYPLVAWYGGTWDEGGDAFNLNFYSVGSIVRLQIFNAGSFTLPVRSLEVSSTTERLNGLFTVNDYKTANPYLVPAASPTTAERKITLDCGESGLTFNPGDLLTFYVVLPSVSEENSRHDYALTLTVRNTADQTSSRNFTVKTTRNSITYLPALGISTWGSGTPAPGLSGNGTERRPFRVYNKADLLYLRSCYLAAGSRTINGQPITSDTYIQIMRSDIALHGDEWPGGIENFIGHISYVPSTGYILNNTRYPLFENILAGGNVHSLKVCYDTNAYSGTSFSPLCRTNAGTIDSCSVVSNTAAYGGIHYTTNDFANGIAGICLNNTGVIAACECSATFYNNSGQRIAGICLDNSGTVRTSHVVGIDATSSGSHVSGICDNNAGNIVDCYFDARPSGTSACSWYGIARTNSGTILHSYASAGTSITTTQSACGIVGENTSGGVINSCYTRASLSGQNTVAGIAGTQSGGTIINCDFYSSTALIRLSGSGLAIGGLVGKLSGGYVYNSYVYISNIGNTSASGVSGGIVGDLSGGAVENCYAYIYNASTLGFYGTKTGGTLTGCYLVDGVSQADVTGRTETQATDGTLLGELTSGKASITNARDWTPDDDDYPILVSYSAKSRRR